MGVVFQLEMCKLMYTHSTHPQSPHSWGKWAAHNRAQMVYYIAENLELRHNKVAEDCQHDRCEDWVVAIVLFVLQVMCDTLWSCRL